ncbi:cell division protein SepF [Tersicoccus sp. MR15.9]|uniref:cell division protein SepF n=1 Tax=Tersicoccus mangrovi TaxID=3121635 RepID=UPI002FE65142
MAGTMRKAMVYLGLADGDEDYDAPAPVQRQETAYEQPERETRREAPRPVPGSDDYRAPVTPIKRATSSREESTELHQITTVHPRSYNDAKVIGESFRDGIPVIMNVTDMGESDAKRLVDFSAGLVFGLHGSIERVTSKVFLLTPSYVEVLGEEKKPQDTTAAGFFNQS